MVPFVLPNVLLIAEECTKEEYVRLIMPDLSPVFKLQEPVQVNMFVQDLLHVPAPTLSFLYVFFEVLNSLIMRLFCDDGK